MNNFPTYSDFNGGLYVKQVKPSDKRVIKVVVNGMANSDGNFKKSNTMIDYSNSVTNELRKQFNFDKPKK